MANRGKVLQIIGPAVDVEFDEGQQPAIHNALRITSEGFDVPEPLDVIVEVQQHLGEGRVRCVAMQPTDGMVRGMVAEDQAAPICVPVGQATLGRVMNVIGEAVDRVNADLSVTERVRRFIFADEPFSIENEEMTPSMKIRRHKIRERYAERLDALYRS